MQSDSDGVTFQISMIKLPIRALPSSSSRALHTEANTRAGVSDDLLSDKSSPRDFRTRTQTSPVLRRGIMECHLAGRVSLDPGRWEYEALTLVAI